VDFDDDSSESEVGGLEWSKSIDVNVEEATIEIPANGDRLWIGVLEGGKTTVKKGMNDDNKGSVKANVNKKSVEVSGPRLWNLRQTSTSGQMI